MSLPPLQAGWAEALLGQPVGSEPRSTCADCAMASGPAPAFRADLKCCMYLPRLPNFVVGRILADPTAAREPVRARLADPRQRTPWGLERPADWSAAYAQALQDGRFGQQLDLRCPHWLDADGGTCGIWAHREATCSTWHCRVDRGAVGKAMWTALRRWLEDVQDLVARWCVEQVGRPQTWDAAEAEAFYRACGQQAEGLTLETIKRLGGFGLRIRSRELRATWRERAHRALPLRLEAGRWRVVFEDTQTVELRSYGDYDGLTLSRGAFAALAAFDGRPVAQVMRGLGAAAPDPDSLQAWVDHGLLQSSDPHDGLSRPAPRSQDR
ncbi:MAG: hypothetical protein H6739_29140 [Alphaproteobacteria bacterium]|nr:hypothetical protein [Alphaproteobacteria bacterium]